MKFILLSLALFFSLEIKAQNSCTYADNGTNTNYTLNANEVLCIESGTYTGTILSLGETAEIRIAVGATFDPQSIQNAAGLITNNGIMRLNSTNELLEGFAIINDSNGVAEINVPQTLKGSINISNALSAQMKFATSFSFDFSSTFTNEGIVNFAQSLSSSELSTISNEGLFYVGNDLNINGTAYNNGIFKTSGFTQLTSTSTFINKCTYHATKTFANNSAFTENYGFIEINPTLGSTDNLFENNANFYNDAEGVVQTERFINTANVLGAGTFVALGFTQNSGNFGTDGIGINFYDASPTGSQVFDEQNASPDASVTRYSVPILDSNYISSNCNQKAFPLVANIPLPVMLHSFEVINVNCNPMLSWITTQEKNCNYFDIERKSKGTEGFQKIASINAKGGEDLMTSYTFEDEKLENGVYQYRLKMVDIDGHYTYSKVSSIHLFCGESTAINIFPNPASTSLQLAMNANDEDIYSISIVDIFGRKVYAKTAQFVSGLNTLQIPVSDFANGQYLISVTNNVHTNVVKFLKAE